MSDTPGLAPAIALVAGWTPRHLYLQSEWDLRLVQKASNGAGEEELVYQSSEGKGPDSGSPGIVRPRQ
jgi:hypothetical protein